MAMFITRVELHGVNHDHEIYNTLHRNMEAKGFSRTIPADDGNSYHLLTAEYYMDANYTIDNVLEMAKAAAKATYSNYSVFVTEGAKMKWNNLKQA